MRRLHAIPTRDNDYMAFEVKRSRGHPGVKVRFFDFDFSSIGIWFRYKSQLFRLSN